MNTTILLSILAELPLKERLGDSNETVMLGELFVKITVAVTEAVFTLQMNGKTAEIVMWGGSVLFLILFLTFVYTSVIPDYFKMGGGRTGALSRQLGGVEINIRQELAALEEQLEKLVDKEEEE